MFFFLRNMVGFSVAILLDMYGMNRGSTLLAQNGLLEKIYVNMYIYIDIDIYIYTYIDR